MFAAHELAVHHRRRAHAGAEDHHHGVLGVLCAAVGELADQRGVGIVVEDERAIESALDPALEVIAHRIHELAVGRDHDLVARVDQAGESNAKAVDVIQPHFRHHAAAFGFRLIEVFLIGVIAVGGHHALLDDFAVLKQRELHARAADIQRQSHHCSIPLILSLFILRSTPWI